MDVAHGFTVEGEDDPEDSFAVAAEAGFNFVELNMDHAFHRSRLDPGRVRALSERFDVDLVVHLPYRLDAASPAEHVRRGARRELLAAVDAACETGADRGVFHARSLAHPKKWSHEQVRGLVVDSVAEVADRAADRGFEACAENLKGPFVDISDFPTLVERTDASLCLDTGHAYATGHDAAWQADFLRRHGDRVAHVHLNDTRDDDDDEHLPVGIGHVDFERIAAAMRETDWSGTCTHEVYDVSGHEYAVHSRDAFESMLSDA